MAKQKNQTIDNDDDSGLEDKIDSINIEEKTELRQVMDNLDTDTNDRENLSAIDLNANISQEQATGCMIVEELNRLGVLPDVQISRKLKRLSLSVNCIGREQKVQMVVGERANKSGNGFLSRIKNAFSPQQPNQ